MIIKHSLLTDYSLQKGIMHYSFQLSTCLLDKGIDYSHILDSGLKKHAHVVDEMKRVVKFIAFACLNIQAGDLTLSAEGCIRYQDEALRHDSMVKLGVLKRSAHYTELVSTTMTEFGVWCQLGW